MVFKRRDRRPLWRIVVEALWPRGGWGRAVRYIRHRLNRLPDPPHRIARGIFAGVLTTFTPFYGLHFVFAALLAWILRGNILAALLSTFFGNPLTYVPIGVVSMKTGYWLLGMHPEEGHGRLVDKFFEAGDDLWDNLSALFTGKAADWHGLAIFYDEVFYPYMIGGIIPGIVTGLVMYYVSLPLITAYQNRRKGRAQGKAGRVEKEKGRGSLEMSELEENMAHLIRMVEDLSDVVARQDKELTQLRARVDLLMRREAERETQGGGGVVIGDERPPHY